MFLALATGIVAGIVHVLTGPDHLAAISPFAVDQSRKVWKVGLFWGLGHSWGVGVVAGLVILFKEFVPLATISRWSESLVGITLIAVGIWALRRAYRDKIHFHEHSHDRGTHAHFHVHDRADASCHDTEHDHSHGPLGIGLLHGLAGSSHLLAVLPAIVLPTAMAAGAYVVGYGLGSITAMSLFSWLLGKLVGRWVRAHGKAYSFVLSALAFVAMGVGIAWLSMPL